MIDIHTHLYFPQYDEDRAATIARAFAAGLTRMISVGTEPDDWAKALAITAADTRIRAAIGFHPHWFNKTVVESQQSAAGKSLEETLQEAMQQLRTGIIENREKIVALGECGLDYFAHGGHEISDEQKAFQKQGFRAQIEMTKEYGLPIIVHTRPSAGAMDAYEDVLAILTQETNEGTPKQASSDITPIILHCYMGDTVVTQQFLTLPRVFFSFTGNVTYPTKKILSGTKDDLSETVQLIPLERFLTETDCPFLAPQAYRGGRNEPSYVAEVVKKVAEIKEISTDQVEEATERNAAAIFGTF